jgi:hypothetical protein
MTTNHNTHEKSKQRVRDYGEVFTPSHIVDKMCDMVPENVWKDPTYIYLEPTCGTGNFLVAILQKRIDTGMPLNKALNTLWGMDILSDNIYDSQVRLCEIVIKKMRNAKKGGPGSDWWRTRACHYVAIIENNIFVVKDSLEYMSSGKFDDKKFVFEDPTGNENVMSDEESQDIVDNLLTRYDKLRIINKSKQTNDILSMFI